MKQHHDYLNPLCRRGTLDTFCARRAILSALLENLPALNGVVLDIGCGDMPYKPVVLAPPSRVEKYIGLDLGSTSYQKPDLEWDGQFMPLQDSSIDSALATELFEHCPKPGLVMREAVRVLKPGGVLFFTVPFLWPLHCVPHDEYRYTPFALERLLRDAGFGQIHLQAMGGWDMSLAQMLGLWARRRPTSSRKRAIYSTLVLPFVRVLAQSGRHRAIDSFCEGSMITGLYGSATKPPPTTVVLADRDSQPDLGAFGA